MQVASRVMEQVNAHNPDAVFVDGTGIGWGVVDRLQPARLPQPARASISAAGADRTDGSDAAARYANKRAEMWGFMKEWCKSGCLPDDRELDRRPGRGRLRLRRARTPSCSSARMTCGRGGLASPDDGDALALTFAYPVAQARLGRGAPLRRGPHEAEAMGGVRSMFLPSCSSLLIFLSPLGERLGEGVNPKIVSCITPSPRLSPKGGAEHEGRRP